MHNNLDIFYYYIQDLAEFYLKAHYLVHLNEIFISKFDILLIQNPEFIWVGHFYICVLAKTFLNCLCIVFIKALYIIDYISACTGMV